MATTSTINHEDIHQAHSVGVTLHQLAQQMTNCTSSSVDSDSAKSSLCSDATPEDLIFFHTQSNPIMEGFLLEGDTGSSRESLANLLDEGLGTSLDGTESEATHPTLGRNDSGVFSSDEMSGIPQQNHIFPSSSCSSSSTSMTIQIPQPSGNVTPNSSVQVQQHKKFTNRQKNASPNRQAGPQRCVICSKTFSNASALTKHKLTHSDERRHTCSVCAKAFKRQDHLNGHMLTHRSKKPFECSANDCGKSYCDARSLRRHVESRHGSDTLATMTIAPTPHTESEFSIIIPSSTSSSSSSKPNNGCDPNKSKSHHPKSKKCNKSQTQKAKAPKVAKSLNSISSQNNNNGSANPNPLLCQGSSSPHDEEEDGGNNTGVDDHELLTSVENLLSMEDSTSAENAAAALLESSLIEMGVIHEELEDEMGLDEELCLPSSSSDDKLNNNSSGKNVEDFCCIQNSDIVKEGSPSQSQLHQLLTQRAVAALVCRGDVSENDVDAAAVTLIKESLIASCANNNGNGLFPTKQFHLHLSSSSPSSTTSSWCSSLGNSSSDNSEMGKCSSSLGGIVLKCPSSPQLSSPHSLKEQLELIHQIIQQTTEESAVIYSSGIHQHQGFSNAVPTTKQSLPPSTTTTTILNGGVTSNSKSSSPTAVDANKNKATSQVGGVGSGSNHNGGGGAGDINVILGGGDENSSTQNPTGKAEDKPVECAICCRRFKNTPALNGHMRLHGGYFKKETDGRKKEPATKETQGAPLQTASVSVRALIEEKIIQRQRNAGSLSSSASSTPKTSPPTSSPTTPTKKPLVPLQSSPPPPLSSSANTSQFHQADVHNLPKNNSSNPTLTFTSSNQHCQPLPFEDSHAEYLLEEEVFNKVSSICPDSFFSSIDESMLCESGIGTGSDSSQISADFFNYSLFTTEPATPTASSNDNPFTPLPTMDPIFFTPAPGSVHSQSGDLDSCLADSPSFIYPTPPASLESHNALQSPLFPFPFPFETTSQNVTHANLMANSNQQLVMVSPVATSSNGMKTVSINCANNNNNGTPSNLLTTSISALGASSHNLTQTSGLLLTTSQMQAMEQCSISGSQPSFSFTLGRETDGNCEQSNISNHSLLYDTNSSRLPVSLPSPSISAISSSPSTMITTSSYTLGGVSTGNEPCLIMGDSLEESFRSPHRIFTLNVNPNSLISKVPKRKGYATLASNLRPQTSQSPPHFTPYPILSPVRSAPGLFWTFSAKLTHVDDNRKDRPRINLGINFQAVIPPLEQKHTIKNNYMLKRPEDLLWSPDSISNCFKEDVEKYLEFACCSAIPGGGRNIEYALHILNLCNGDINVAMLLLMNPEPKLPVHLFQYKYPEREKWTRQEILQFQESLVRHGKDFLEVSKELVTKSGEACVSFYQLWKKVCPNEYERIRSMWKKREAAFTVELLKTIPPVPTCTQVQLPTTSQKSSVSAKQNKSHQTSPASSRGLSLNDEYPCKICGNNDLPDF